MFGRKRFSYNQNPWQRPIAITVLVIAIVFGLVLFLPGISQAKKPLLLLEEKQEQKILLLSDNSIISIQLKDKSINETILPLQPKSIEKIGNDLLVAVSQKNTKNGALLQLDSQNFAVKNAIGFQAEIIKAIPVDSTKVLVLSDSEEELIELEAKNWVITSKTNTGSNPIDFVISNDKKMVFVLNNAKSTISTISLESHESKETGKIKFQEKECNNPKSIVLNQAKNRAYVSCEGTIFNIELEKMNTINYFELEKSIEAKILLNAGKETLIVLDRTNNNIIEIDLETFKEKARFATKNIQDIELDEKGKQLFAINQKEGKITIFETTKWKPIDTIQTGNKKIQALLSEAK